MMKILYIANANVKGGATIALINLIKGMKARGHHILVAIPLGDGYLPQALDTLQIPYVRINSALSVYPVNPNPILYPLRLLYTLYRQISCTLKLVQVIHTFKPDIVHTNVGPMSIGYNACQFTNTPHIWHHREYQDLDFNLYFFPAIGSFLRKARNATNSNIVITRGIFDYRHFRNGTDEVIYDGVFSKDLEKNLPIAEKTKTVLFVGRIEEAKGLDDLIEAFAVFSMRHPDYILQVIGDTPPDSIPYLEKCKNSIRDKGVDDKVRLLGRKDNVYEYMSKAAMIVVPSRFEGFGFITAEAMACGCPVIGRNTAGTKEQLDNGLQLTGEEIGFRFTTREELVSAMEKVATEDVSDMCIRAQKTVFSMYTIEQHVENVETFYRKVMNRTKDK